MSEQVESQVRDQVIDIADAPDLDEANTKRVELSAEEAIAKLKAGQPVENARVRKLRFKGTIDYAIVFRNCLLVQPEFHSATFTQPVSMVACTIDRLKCVKKNTFAAQLNLASSTFNKTIFGGLDVHGEFNAASSVFRGKSGFKDCVFQSHVNFWSAQFTTWIDFTKCVFHGDADFRSVHCDQGFVLGQGTVCHCDFLFRGGTVEKKFQLDGARFEACIDLSKAKLQDFAYLEAIEQGPQQTFSFLNAVAERIRVRPEQLDGRLLSERNGKHEDAMQEYGLLKKCYSALHRFDQEDWAFYRFKVAQRKSKSTSWRKPWTVSRTFCDWLFLDVGCGYGTNPLRAVRMALVIILGFAVVYGANIEQFYTEKLPFPEYEKTALVNRVMVGLTTSVSVFTSGMGGIREIAKSWMNIPVMVESIMGTLLFGLFIVAFSRKVIR